MDVSSSRVLRRAGRAADQNGHVAEPAPLRNLNLNLLEHLDALLTQRTVSGAAERLGLSQPTVSSALQRLRRHFGDELLVRSGAGHELTPLAVELRPLVAAAIAAAERVFTSTTVFDPVTSTREFRLVAGDYWVASVGAALARAVEELRSSVRLRFGKPARSVVERTTDTLRTVDGVLSPHGEIRGVRHTDLCTAEWGCLVDAGNTRVGERLTQADLLALPWVSVATAPDQPQRETLALRRLRLAGVDPRVAVTVESFLAVPRMIAGTDRIAIVHRGMVGWLAESKGLRLLPCPVELDPLRLALWWHPQFEADAGHRWLRDTLRDVTRDLEV